MMASWSALGRAAAPLLEAARLVPMEQAERRVLVLRNPGLGGAYAATATLFAGLQIILPGETAPSHHHTPAALRLIVEAARPSPPWTACAATWSPAILVTPMRWHDHGHEGTAPVIWLDGLDIPLVRAFEASWASKMRPAATPATATDSSQDEFAAAGLISARLTLSGDGLSLKSGGPGAPSALPSSAWPRPPPSTRRSPFVMSIRRRARPPASPPWAGLRGGCARRLARAPTPRRERGVRVHRGPRQSRVGDAVLTWEAGDCFVAPPWHWVEHHNAAPASPRPCSTSTTAVAPYRPPGRGRVADGGGFQQRLRDRHTTSMTLLVARRLGLAVHEQGFDEEALVEVGEGRAQHHDHVRQGGPARPEKAQDQQDPAHAMGEDGEPRATAGSGTPSLALNAAARAGRVGFAGARYACSSRTPRRGRL